MLAPMLTARPRAARRSSCRSRSSGPDPSAFRISVVTPWVSMLTALTRPSGVAWLWMLMKPGATNCPVASTSTGRAGAGEVADAGDRAVGDRDVGPVARGAAAIDHRAVTDDRRRSGRCGVCASDHRRHHQSGQDEAPRPAESSPDYRTRSRRRRSRYHAPRALPPVPFMTSARPPISTSSWLAPCATCRHCRTCRRNSGPTRRPLRRFANSSTRSASWCEPTARSTRSRASGPRRRGSSSRC